MTLMMGLMRVRTAKTANSVTIIYCDCIIITLISCCRHTVLVNRLAMEVAIISYIYDAYHFYFLEFTHIYSQSCFQQQPTLFQIFLSYTRMSILQWTLREEFIMAEIDRLNHPEYFAPDFQCPDMDSLFAETKTYGEAITNRELLNKVFDNLIASNCSDRTIYVRLKWLAYLHRLIHQSGEGDLMATLTLKALQVYTDKLHLMGLEHDPFSKYLSKALVKPYLQYLSKRCMLLLPDKYNEDKQNFLPTQTPSKAVHKTAQSIGQTGSLMLSCQDRLKWYREYNFVREALETFSTVLIEQEPFFASELPCLLSIRASISCDLKNIFKKWKTNLMELGELGITLIELEKLEVRISEFGRKPSVLFDNSQSMMTEVEDYTKQEITNFLCTPLKPLENMNYSAHHTHLH